MSDGPGAAVQPPPAPAPRPTSRLAAQLAKQPLRRLGLVGGVLLLAASAGFGGLEPAADAGPAALAALTVGSVVDTGPYRVELVSARVVDEVDRVFKSDPADRWVAVVVNVTGQGQVSTPVSLLQESVVAPELAGVVDDGFSNGHPDRASSVLVTADSTTLGAVPPGLTFRVALLWEQRGDVPAPTSVRVGVVGHTYRASTIDAQLEWLDATPVAVGDLAVTAPPGGS